MAGVISIRAEFDPAIRRLEEACEEAALGIHTWSITGQAVYVIFCTAGPFFGVGVFTNRFFGDPRSQPGWVTAMLLGVGGLCLAISLGYVIYARTIGRRRLIREIDLALQQVDATAAYCLEVLLKANVETGSTGLERLLAFDEALCDFEARSIDDLTEVLLTVYPPAFLHYLARHGRMDVVRGDIERVLGHRAEAAMEGLTGRMARFGRRLIEEVARAKTPALTDHAERLLFEHGAYANFDS